MLGSAAGETKGKRRGESGPHLAPQRFSMRNCVPPVECSNLDDESNTTQLFHLPYNLAAVSYDRGVLQESIMYLEIIITRVFDGLRLLLRTMLLLPPKCSSQYKNAVKPTRHTRSSFHEMVRKSSHINSIFILC